MSGYTPHKNPAGQALTYNFNLPGLENACKNGLLYGGL